MNASTVHLHEAADAEDSFALSLEGDSRRTWRAEKGYGQKFQQVWSVELQSRATPKLSRVDWPAVLDRVIEAYQLSDPVIADFEWPLQPSAARRSD
jgi:hypothetical protein